MFYFTNNRTSATDKQMTTQIYKRIFWRIC